MMLLQPWLVPLLALLLQQPPATPTSLLAWDQPAPDLATAQSASYALAIDQAPPVVHPGVTCAGSASPFLCTLPFPAITPGPHTLTVTTSNTAGSAAASAPLSFTFIAVPSPAMNLRIMNVPR